MKTGNPDPDRAAIIQEQYATLVKLLEANKNKLELREIILAHKFSGERTIKPEAIKLALDTQGTAYSKHQIRSLKEALIAKKIGKVKHAIELEHVRDKDGGVAAVGQVVKKSHKAKDIMQKRVIRDDRMDDDDVPEKPQRDAIEGMASNIFSAMSVAGVSVESPKVRYHRANDGTVTILSTYLEDFAPAAKIEGSGENEKQVINPKFEEEINDPAKFSRFFLANYLIGESDKTASNIDIYLRRIDFGEALNYRASFDSELRELQNPKLEGLYPGKILEGKEFAQGLLDVTKKIDLDLVRYGVKLAIKNMQEAYGPEFINSPKFKEECHFVLGIDSKKTLTPAILEGALMNNFVNRIDQLETYAYKPLGIERPVKEIPTREKPEKITLDNAGSYLDELEYLIAAQKNAYSKANADRISEIKSLQPGSEGSTVKSEQDFSLLKYALSTGRKELAVELAKHSFSLNQSEHPDPKNKQALLDSNNLIRRTLKLLTATDIKREEVIENTPSKILEKEGIDLKKKPSPLFIAIKLGKIDLASEMLSQGFVLKQSEINSILKAQDKKQGIKSSLGFRKRKRSEEIIQEAAAERNVTLPNVKNQKGNYSLIKKK